MLAGGALADPEFYEDFESTPVGGYPSRWHMLFSGEAGYVTDEVHIAGERVFKNVSQASWARMDYVDVREALGSSDLPDYFWFEVTAIAANDRGNPRVGFMWQDPVLPNQGPMANIFSFGQYGGEIWFNNAKLLDSYTIGEKYTVRAELDFTTLTASAYVNGELKGAGIAIQPKVVDCHGIPITLDKLGLAQYNWSPWTSELAVSYYDNFRFGSFNPIPEPFSMAFMASAFLGVVGFRLRRRGKKGSREQ
jgi:hypothetical protein